MKITSTTPNYVIVPQTYYIARFDKNQRESYRTAILIALGATALPVREGGFRERTTPEFQDFWMIQIRITHPLRERSPHAGDIRRFADGMDYSPMIWQTTVRRRGRVSKSTRMICCHVPSINRPSTNGTVREGPSSEARTCEWPLSSCQVFSCS